MEFIMNTWKEVLEKFGYSKDQQFTILDSNFDAIAIRFFECVPNLCSIHDDHFMVYIKKRDIVEEIELSTCDYFEERLPYVLLKFKLNKKKP